MEHALHMTSVSLPIKYLGVQLHRGKERTAHFATLLSTIQTKLAMWQNKFLDQAGRLILIKHVLAAIPLHILSPCQLPQRIIHAITQTMIKFFWGSTDTRKGYAWISSAQLFGPTSEGGLGLRSLSDLQKTYSCRIWWRYQENNSLWSNFLHARYAHRNNYDIRITNSPVWKRICRIHIFCNEHLDQEHRTIRAAYEKVRLTRNSRMSYSFIWHKSAPPQVRLFLWRLYKGALSVPENLQKFVYIHPSQCPFCLKSQITINHTFLHCPEIAGIWKMYATHLDGPSTNATSVQQNLMQWWISTKGKTLKGMFRIVAPDIIVWEIWKTYTSIIYGEGKWKPATVGENIRRALYDWASAQSGKKYAISDQSLITLGLSPKLRPSRCIIVRWIHPPPGKMKLNTDAAHGRFSAAAGAILRDSSGTFIRAISFHLPLSTPNVAELQAAYLSFLYFATQWGSIDVEVDAYGVVTATQHNNDGLATMFRALLRSTMATITYTPREANQPAHYLAQYGQLHHQLTVFPTVASLPSMVRACYLTESIPHLRHEHG